jgi:hypothetical protein
MTPGAASPSLFLTILCSCWRTKRSTDGGSDMWYENRRKKITGATFENMIVLSQP